MAPQRGGPKRRAGQRAEPPRRTPPAPEDVAMFHAAVGAVAPVPSRRRPLDPPAPPPRARFTRADEAAVLDESLHGPAPDALIEAGEGLVYRRPGVSMQVLKDLRRGRYRIQAELDLHGLTTREAKPALLEFMGESLARGLRCVRIVHGKGLRSGPGGPVLKGKLHRWLPQWDRVVAYTSAPARDGGTGALYVLLRA